MAQCNAKKPDGSRCRAKALPGKARCLFHDPASAAKTREGRRAGGLNRSMPAATLPADTPDLSLKTVRDVAKALARTMNEVRTGRLAVSVGNCLGVLAGVLLKALEGGELEKRIAALEARRGR